MSASEAAHPHILARVGTVIRGKYRIDGMGGMALGSMLSMMGAAGCFGGATELGGRQLADGGVDAAHDSDAASPQILSCGTPGDGRTDCGPNFDESCCTSPLVTGGTYNRTYTNDGSGPTGESDPATVSDFRLDKYEVTVGRFRQFVAAFDNGYSPPEHSGKHDHLNGGKGLAATGGGYEPGWSTFDNARVAPSYGHLTSCGPTSTWKGGDDRRPINCVSWFEAYAFCIWDGGFLPSEAEWEYAAAGGREEREYPWGPQSPGKNNEYAIYGCYYPSSSDNCGDVSNIAPVGTAASGTGKYQQLDLAGNVSEWNLDWYSSSYSACSDCTNATPSDSRVERGDYFSGSGVYALPPNRFDYAPPAYRTAAWGFRCARTP